MATANHRLALYDPQTGAPTLNNPERQPEPSADTAIDFNGPVAAADYEEFLDLLVSAGDTRRAEAAAIRRGNGVRAAIEYLEGSDRISPPAVHSDQRQAHLRDAVKAALAAIGAAEHPNAELERDKSTIDSDTQGLLEQLGRRAKALEFDGRYEGTVYDEGNPPSVPKRRDKQSRAPGPDERDHNRDAVRALHAIKAIAHCIDDLDGKADLGALLPLIWEEAERATAALESGAA